MDKAYDLKRFTDAHKICFENALNEIKNGRKTSCWMWFIFPQIKGLGESSTSALYAINDLKEARAYLQDEYLKNNTIEIINALLALPISNATQIFGYPDNLKLRSSMTLFHYADPSEELFMKVLEKFYGGEPDGKTVEILKRERCI